MSVLIKGMEMPTSCYYCGLTDTSFINCQALSPYRLLEDDCEERRPEWCPLVEIKTPHGKLVEFIDVTTTFDEDSGTEQVNLGDAFSAYFKMRESNAVIEAEGETDE